MRAARSIGALALLFACAGCAQDGSVEQSGTDLYAVSGRSAAGEGGILLAQSAALQDARAFCTSQGRRFAPVSDHVSEGAFSSDVTYTVRFRCPPPGSPDLPRPMVNEAPDDLL